METLEWIWQQICAAGMFVLKAAACLFAAGCVILFVVLFMALVEDEKRKRRGDNDKT